MSLYDRQEKLELNQNLKVTIVGCGGIGYWVAKFCAMSGIDYIELFDPDVLEEHNLNRLDIPLRFIGKNKADVTRLAIHGIREDCTVYAYPYVFNEMGAQKSNWIIDCTDNDKAQLENQRIARKLGVKYFKAGYDGEGFGIHNAVAEWGESTDGYTIVPSWVVPAVIVAALAVAKIMKYEDKEVISSVEKLFRFDR
jgi:molybdopterin/thiamine biosynthesis adenylyltransferase